MKTLYTHRALGTVSGVLGLGLLLSSAVYLIQVLGYQNPGLLYGGYNSQFQGADYYNASYNLFGYQFNPIIAIASVGVVLGALQFIASFALCCSHRYSSASMVWMVAHVILWIGGVVCLSLGFYYEVYLYLYPANGIYYDANTGFLAPNGNPRLNGYSGYNNNPYTYSQGGFGGFGGAGFNSGLRNLFGYNGSYNPSGQAYLAFLGINLVFLIIAFLVVGCSARRDKYTAQQSYDSKPYHPHHHHHTPSPATTRM